MGLNKEQLAVVNAKESFVIVNSAQASGKTTTITARLIHLLNIGVDPTQIVVITFTNHAAAVLRERIGLHRAKGMYIGTVHGYCNMLLLRGGIDTSKYLTDERFDELFEKIEDNPYCLNHVEHLLVDEAQDSSDSQFDFFDLINPDNRMYVGDFHQAIYQFNGGNVNRFMSYANRPDVKTYNLFRNYRNGSKILSFAKDIIRENGRDYIDHSLAERDEEGSIYKFDFNLDREMFDLIIKSIGKDDYGKWFILCRFNSQIEYVSKVLNELNIPYDSFRQAELRKEELDEKMHSNTVKLLTIHSSKGLEADNVMVIGANTRTRDETCVAYVAATRAKKNLYWLNMGFRRKKKDFDNVVNWES